jgi:hypothetical protein
MDKLPRFLGMARLRDALGISEFKFRRLCDQYQIPRIVDGRKNLIEVEPAIKVFARVPGIETIISDQGMELIRRVREPEVQAVA